MAFGRLAAMLFGSSTPAAKQLLGDVRPQLLAGLLYPHVDDSHHRHPHRGG